MKYLKPTAYLMAMSGSGSSTGSCSTTKEDLQTLADIYGVDINVAFAMGEGCQEEIPIEEYCAYTSVENGVAVKALFS